MTEKEWLVSTDPAAMLTHLTRWPKDGRSVTIPDSRRIGGVSDRKLRLIACAMCRSVWPMITDERSRRAVETAEQFAAGLIRVI